MLEVMDLHNISLVSIATVKAGHRIQILSEGKTLLDRGYAYEPAKTSGVCNRGLYVTQCASL